MLKKLVLKFTDGNHRIEFDPRGITVFVGPNNSGKSLILREVEAAIRESNRNILESMNILQDIEPEQLNEQQIEKIMQSIATVDARISSKDDDSVTIFLSGGEGSLSTERITKRDVSGLAKLWADKQYYINDVLKRFLIRLDGRARFDLTRSQGVSDLTRPPTNILGLLLINDALRSDVQSHIFNALGLYFVVDPTRGTKYHIRLSKENPQGYEQSLTKDARAFLDKATDIQDVGDGFKAYVGIISAVLAGHNRIFLIDEPEAFLHPPLARKLGTQLASLVAEREGVMLASTHSADFLMGCIQAGRNIRVIRLEYRDGRSKATLADTEVLNKLFRDPRMRSANVASALFYDGVVVTEADSDRVFYSEIYHRFAESEKNMPSILFVHA
ncbi:MAG: ATP-binding protein [Rhodospirillales bacterium]|nr:ATP-binding protein [Rhodospirillales bacterium]